MFKDHENGIWHAAFNVCANSFSTHSPNNNPSMKIKSVSITPMLRSMPDGMFDPMPAVVATFEDGSTKRLLSFFPDEVSFQPSEFTGFTEEEAHSLFQRKRHHLPPVMKQPQSAR